MILNEEYRCLGINSFYNLLEIAYIDLGKQNPPKSDEELNKDDFISRMFYKMLDQNSKERLSNIYRIDEYKMNSMLEGNLYHLIAREGKNFSLIDKSGREYAFKLNDNCIIFCYGIY